MSMHEASLLACLPFQWFACHCRFYCMPTFAGWWVESDVFIIWPLWSSDLKLLYIFLLGCVTVVCAKQVGSMKYLWPRIAASIVTMVSPLAVCLWSELRYCDVCTELYWFVIIIISCQTAILNYIHSSWKLCSVALAWFTVYVKLDVLCYSVFLLLFSLFSVFYIKYYIFFCKGFLQWSLRITEFLDVVQCEDFERRQN